MKVSIELPTWLGDTIMASPAIENLINYCSDSEITLIGSDIAIEAMKNHPKVTKTYVLEKNYISLYRTILSMEEFDIFVSFRGSIRSKLIKFCISAKTKHQFDKNIYKQGHQVEKYNNFVNDSFNINSIPSRLILHTEKKMKGKNKLVGLNPGASYGNSKRWYPKEFAAVANDLSRNYDIIIFGGPGEKDIAAEIEGYLIKYGVDNYQNLANKTSVTELISHISSLDLFITGDSGPMHIAAALQVPTVTIFGPTNDKVTSQWMNTKNTIVKKNLDCQPCMKRICPLSHHNCMALIKSIEVLDAVKTL